MADYAVANPAYAPGGACLIWEGLFLLDPSLVRRELINRTAELAGHDYLAVLYHIGALLWREAPEHRRYRIART